MSDRLNILCINAGNSRTGAPILFIKLLKFLKNNYAVNLTILTTTNGALIEEFKSTGTTYQWDGSFQNIDLFDKFYFTRLCKRAFFKISGVKRDTFQDKIVLEINKQKIDLIYTNSVSSLFLLEEIKKRISLKCKTILHIHELEIAIGQFSNVNSLMESREFVNQYIAVSNAVKDLLINKFNINENSISLIYGCVEPNQKEQNNESSVFTICGCGTLDWRKGIDIFIQLAALFKDEDDINFLWIGGNPDSLDYKKVMYDIDRLKLKNIKITGEVNNPLDYMASANVFVLTSREDPFPLVCLESASLGKPIICFDQAGGMPEFVSDKCGYIVPYLSLESMRDKIYYLKKNKNIAEKMGNNAFERVNKFHTIGVIAPQIMQLFDKIVKNDTE
jgi:glycosyltransferase involved in cell wall biosynthesis